MYYEISLKYKFKYIMKMHTKTIRPQFDELIDFLLSNSLENILKFKKPLSNCIGNEKHYMNITFQKNINNYDIFNKILIERYKDEIDKKKQLFVAGTIFFILGILGIIEGFRNISHGYNLESILVFIMGLFFVFL
jgi:hypothetical protein